MERVGMAAVISLLKEVELEAERTAEWVRSCSRLSWSRVSPTPIAVAPDHPFPS